MGKDNFTLAGREWPKVKWWQMKGMRTILGRRTGVVIGCSIMLVGVALICIGFHVALFIVDRLILGFGIGIAHGSAPLLIAELVHLQHRATYSTVYNTLWCLGSSLAPGSPSARAT
ncbi:hypothetical protein B0T18DRAFT_447743 [Schizothecium vesticola]|uniref:Major facilitator superfamily (MFS) profile domain-containing protein n=1 Tax=Schizothecium vesticola TaxID=314040 RepID=A0AA40EP45_9PEZI|nr:hypothetical protein B0T18DRAFT_447743 [Schizothecium vesticola]